MTEPVRDTRITQAEMVRMFGSEMPVEALHLLWAAPDDWTVDQVRDELRRIAIVRRASDDPVTTVYGQLLWHHMDALRKGDEAMRARVFDAVETMRVIWPAETKVWEDRYTPSHPSRDIRG